MSSDTKNISSCQYIHLDIVSASYIVAGVSREPLHCEDTIVSQILTNEVVPVLVVSLSVEVDGLCFHAGS